jgi:hypothetical protein
MDDESSGTRRDSGESAPAARGDLEGARVLILTGKFKGNEGVCLGPSPDDLWAVSPDGAADILSLEFEKDFALLVDLSADPTRN